MTSANKDTTLKQALELVNSHLSDANIYFLANDPERTLGLEGLLPNLHLVHIDDSQYLPSFKSHKIPHFCLEEYVEQNDTFRSSLKLIKHEKFQRYFESTKQENNYIQTFKISPAFLKQVAALGAQSLNTEPHLNRMFENKLSQFEQLQKAQVPLPDSLIVELGETSYALLSSTFGATFVIQFDRGHTGEGTMFVESEDDFARIQQKYPKRTVRIAEFIEGEAYTLNGCVTEQGIFLGGLSYQVTGVSELTTMRGATVGNDLSYRNGMTEDMVREIDAQVTKIGQIMYEQGYQGLFGVDLIIREGDLFFIEINARQPASIPMYTKLQLMEKQIPLSLIHLLEFLDVNYSLDPAEYNQEALAPIDAAQVFLRADQEYSIKDTVEMGSYRLVSDNTAIDRYNDEIVEGTIFLDEEKDKPIIITGKPYAIDQVKEGFLLLTPKQGKLIKRGRELARVQVRQSLIHDGNLAPWVIETLLAVKRIIT